MAYSSQERLPKYDIRNNNFFGSFNKSNITKKKVEINKPIMQEYDVEDLVPTLDELDLRDKLLQKKWYNLF